MTSPALGEKEVPWCKRGWDLTSRGAAPLRKIWRCW